MIGSPHRKSSCHMRSPVIVKKHWTLFIVSTITILACAVSVFRARAATPPTGTITPTSAPVTWDGTAAGGTSNGESTCVEGVNCDTYTLTVAGTPADWAGKRIQITFSWVVLASDYDLYIHKCPIGPPSVAACNAGTLVDSSTGGAPSTSETAEIDPAINGTGVFTVHAVYFTAAPADQYHAVATVISSATGTPTPTPTLSTHWNIVHHGTCCEGNLGASGPNTYVLLPELTTGNDIKRSTDDGKTWTKKYPPVDVSDPYGIEGDLQAFGDDVVFFGTELTHGVAAHSDDRGNNWTVVPIPVPFPANDQAWSYLGPFSNISPVGQSQTEPYVLTGWYRIGSVALFSFDGGLTWPIQTPLVGNDGDGPIHVVCQQTAHDPTSPGDTRIPNADFANKKAGRHGGWGTDRKFYWTETANGNLYVCKTDNFGATWTGIKHPIATGPASSYVVTHAAFDNKGTLYVLHGNKLYVSFNQGESFAFVHTLPRWGNALRSDSGADQFFVINCGTIHIGLLEDGGGGTGNVWYLRGTHVDTANPTWDQELVDVVGNVRLDFMQIVLNGNNIPTISYTTPNTEVTTASRDAPLPSTPVNVALSSLGATATASSIYAGRSYPPEGAINGNHIGNDWESGGGWNDDTRDVWPDSLEVNLNGNKTLSQIRVYTLQDNFQNPVEPTPAMTCEVYGLIDFDVQYWNGTSWVTVPGGAIRNNNKVITTITGLNITTSKLRVYVTSARSHFSRVVEVEAYECDAP
jgi:hypothetical protein